MSGKHPFEHIPVTLEKTASMKNANSRRKIYNGAFVLRGGDKLIPVNGTIYFSWLPTKLGVVVIGQPSDHFAAKELLIYQFQNINAEVFIDESFFGKGIIRKLSLDNFSFEIRISGRTLLGDNSKLVDRILFSVPNLKSFIGTNAVRQISKYKGSIANNRIVFENEKFKVTLDKRFDSNKIQESLDENGGFGIMYSGQLEKKGEMVSFDEAAEVINCLNRFLTFINGRKVSALFIKGKLNRETIWEDFTCYKNDPYKSVSSWSTNTWTQHHSDLWKTFYTLFFDDSYRTILSTTVYWYTEANGNSGVEAKSVLAQAALELIYNWQIEVNQTVVSPNIDKSSAAGKLRAILHTIGQTTDIPKFLEKLTKFLQQYKVDIANDASSTSNAELVDACFIIARIRNSLVHSDIRNRKKLRKIPDVVLSESVSLSMWYIELAVLNILGYNGKYHNRCSAASWQGMEDYVPWAGMGDDGNQ